MSEVRVNLDKKVKDIMEKNVVSVKANTPVLELIKTMKKNRISGLVVVDAVGEVLGVISAIDVFKIFRDHDVIDSLVAEDIMTPFSVDITPEDSVMDAALTMLDNNIHRLVVTVSPSHRKPVGILTTTDLIHNLF